MVRPGSQTIMQRKKARPSYISNNKNTKIIWQILEDQNRNNNSGKKSKKEFSKTREN